MLERVLPPLVSRLHPNPSLSPSPNPTPNPNLHPNEVSRLQLDDDKDTVAAASEALADVAKLVGPPAVAARGAALAQVVTRPTCSSLAPHLLLAI